MCFSCGVLEYHIKATVPCGVYIRVYEGICGYECSHIYSCLYLCPYGGYSIPDHCSSDNTLHHHINRGLHELYIFHISTYLREIVERATASLYLHKAFDVLHQINHLVIWYTTTDTSYSLVTICNTNTNTNNFIQFSQQTFLWITYNRIITKEEIIYELMDCK